MEPLCNTKQQSVGPSRAQGSLQEGTRPPRSILKGSSALRLTEKIRRSISIDLTNLNRVPGKKNAGQKLLRKIQKTGVVLVAQSSINVNHHIVAKCIQYFVRWSKVSKVRHKCNCVCVCVCMYIHTYVCICMYIYTYKTTPQPTKTSSV